MLYNKKSLFFRKITAKIVGKSSHTRKGDKCHTVQRAPSAHHHQDKSNDGGQPLQREVTEKHLQSTQILSKVQNNNDMKPTSGVANEPVISGLLAAKLQCDEWGIHSRIQAAPKKMSTVSSQASSGFSASPKRRRHPVQRQRLVNNKVHHPSYKQPMLQRSTSMKERREAMENAKKYYLYFSSSLYIIEEVDEMEQ